MVADRIDLERTEYEEVLNMSTDCEEPVLNSTRATPGRWRVLVVPLMLGLLVCIAYLTRHPSSSKTSFLDGASLEQKYPVTAESTGYTERQYHECSSWCYYSRRLQASSLVESDNDATLSPQPLIQGASSRKLEETCWSCYCCSFECASESDYATCPDSTTRMFCDDYDSSTCFPGESVVNVAGKKNVAMADLRSNDLVLVERLQGGLAYEPILGFLHATGYGQESGYLTVVHSIGEVRVSSNHVLFVKSGAGRRDTLASDLKVGDQIYVVDDAGGSLVASSVLSVRRGSTRLGMFAPFTSSGTIVVDDVLASNYGSVPVHSAAHAAMFLARVASSFGLGGSFFQRFASTLGNSAEFNPLVALLLHPYLKLDQLLVKP